MKFKEIGTAQVYLVGGAVRDMLLGIEPEDKDYVVVGADHNMMIEHGFKQVGADFPVYICPDGEEYALARTERKTGPGYHGFETDSSNNVTLKEDLSRRDLTINSMAMTEGGSVIDYFGGESDLRQRVLRHTTDAFQEDPVRVLRVARFAARYNFMVHPDTMHLMTRMVLGGATEDLVPERVWAEISKGIMENYNARMFQVLAECGALHRDLKHFAGGLYGNGIYEFPRRHRLSLSVRTTMIMNWVPMIANWASMTSGLPWMSDYTIWKLPSDVALLAFTFYKNIDVAQHYDKLDPAEKLSLLKTIGGIGSLRNSDLFPSFIECYNVWYYARRNELTSMKTQIEADVDLLNSIDVQLLLTNTPHYAKDGIGKIVKQHQLKLLGATID